jgi:hypothetical protein
MVFLIDLLFYSILLAGMIFLIEGVGKFIRRRWFTDELDPMLLGSIREYILAEEEYSEDYTQHVDIVRLRLARGVLLQNLKSIGHDLYELGN